MARKRQKRTVNITRRFGTGFRGYHLLMPHRVQEVLLVASAYDSFILEEDGRFSDRISDEYMELKLSGAPNIVRVTTAREAIQAIGEHDYDLLLTTGHFSDMPLLEMASAAKQACPELPVVYLAFDRREAAELAAAKVRSVIDYVFQLTGDPRIFLAVVKTVEDRQNVEHDTHRGLVRVILVVEDSPAFYSSYLPLIYTEVMEQTRRLMAERINEVDRMSRMRARPKILLARTYQEATSLFDRYRKYILGVITDMRFPRNDVLADDAGLHFIRAVQAVKRDIPILLQSAEPAQRELASELGIEFADKNSTELLHLLREFMCKHFGFGPFIFLDASGTEIARADDMRALLACLPTVPDESIKAHAVRNDFSNWFMARSEFALATELRPHKVTDFDSIGALRSYLITSITQFLERQQRGQVTDFAREGYHLTRDFSRLGVGSLGGKARGIAFLGMLLADDPIHDRYPGLRVFVPRSTVICSSFFDQVIQQDGLHERAITAENDHEVQAMFLGQALPEGLMVNLAALLREVRYPIAVRSSSLLEDSRFQPFAGVYATYLLPNNAPTLTERLAQLCEAIKLIYASTFTSPARAYMRTLGQRVEEEKMAIVIQRLQGTAHGRHFYPEFAGVAKSHNYYPVDFMKPEDGFVTVALGLGRTVVEGTQALHFCPVYPRQPMQMSTTADALRNSQRQFYALDLEGKVAALAGSDMATLVRLELETADADGTLDSIGATYVHENDRIYDSVKREGTRLVNFAGVLKYDKFPLAPLVDDILKLTSRSVGMDVELEFAVNLRGSDGDTPEFALLQLRPMVTDTFASNLEPEIPRAGEQVLLRGRALGGSGMTDLTDVIYVHPERYDRTRSPDVARLIGAANQALRETGRRGIFMAPGRWGSADRFLGVPVVWHDISEARMIVELSTPDYAVDPSQGSHFFHNLTSLRVAYFSINIGAPDEMVDLEWLESLPALHQDEFVRWVRTPVPLRTRIHSQRGRGLLVRVEKTNESARASPIFQAG